MAFSDDFQLAENNAFQQQVQMAVFKTALRIVHEVATSHPALDSKRHNLAAQVLAMTGSYGLPSGPMNLQFCWACVETGLAEPVTDEEILSAVDTVWNAVAGVSFLDMNNV